jgi:hypothetical protein
MRPHFDFDRAKLDGDRLPGRSPTSLDFFLERVAEAVVMLGNHSFLERQRLCD